MRTKSPSTVGPAAGSSRKKTRSVWRRRTALAVALLMLVPAGLLLAAYPVSADATTIMGATLPTGRAAASAVSDGTYTYLFGGYDGGYQDQIVRYDPAADKVTPMDAKLPTGRYFTSAVWDGSHAYVFGGFTQGSYSNQIVRFDPATDTVTTMTATLPTGSAYTSAVWDGSQAYIFGGYGGHSTQIVQYDPATNTATTMSATLPTGRTFTSAVWDGSQAYIFGGYNGGYSTQILQYDAATDTVTTMSATLPTGRAYTSAAWDGSATYILGGYDGSPVAQIVRYSSTVPDTTPPETFVNAATDGNDATIADGDGTPSSSLTLAFNGTDNVAVTGFECSLDNATYATCTSPTTYSGLALGAHTFQVRALDAAGNMDATSATFDWTVVDATAPDTFVESARDGNDATVADGDGTPSSSLTVGFDGTDNVGVTGFECSLDNATYTSCTSPATYSGLAEGAHTFTVRALDAAGNVDATPAALNWTVQTSAEALEELSQTVQGLGASTGVTTSLVAQLDGAIAKLTDATPKNDAAACTQIQNFLDQAELARDRGELTDAQADDLRDQGTAIQSAAGC